jgi:hypothetical protein
MMGTQATCHCESFRSLLQPRIPSSGVNNPRSPNNGRPSRGCNAMEALEFSPLRQVRCDVQCCIGFRAKTIGHT